MYQCQQMVLFLSIIFQPPATLFNKASTLQTRASAYPSLMLTFKPENSLRKTRYLGGANRDLPRHFLGGGAF